MLNHNQVSGYFLPEKTLCLTFDDGPGETKGGGPGPKTLALANYLHEQEIRAAFFFTGIHLIENPSIMPEVVRLGHVVGNHSYSHHDMPGFFGKGGDIVREILSVDDLLAPELSDIARYFRAPYGLWHETLTEYLNDNLRTSGDYRGPVYWDINCSDFDFWARAAGASECAEAYLTEIERVRRGIVLMHDSTADNDIMKKNNLTYETIRIMVPELKRLGYSIVGLDSIL
jgi:peptidoglycan/xylan/chitin deacetylase (PgdA/CDA1 family)